MIATAKLQGHGASVLCLDVFSPSSQSSSSSSPHSSPFSSSTSALLLSGSEDGTARLWDLRDHKRRACLCIRVPGGGNVLSAVFSPPAPAVEATTITTIRRENDAFSRDCSVYLGVENTVLEYDLRHADSPIICSEPTRDWGRVLQNQDEVNQIGLVYYNKNNGNNNNNNNNNSTTKKKKNQKKKGGGNNNKKRLQSSVEDVPDGSLYLAACDDAGKARWTEVWSSSRESDEASCNHFQHASSTILHHDNHGVAIVPACAFRPSNMNSSHKRRGGGGGGGGTSLEFVTGGTDCKIQLWDIFRSKKPISTFAINNQNTNEDGQSKPQVCNPPFIYSLAWSNDGKSLSAGLGDGTVGVFEINNRTLVQSQSLRGSEGADGTMHFAHDSSVASVVYPSFSALTSNRILCSAGSDGAIVFWDLGKPPNDEEWDDSIGKKNHNCDDDNDSDTNSDDAVAQLFTHGLMQKLRSTNTAEVFNSTPTPLSHKPRIIFDIPHGEKINWVTPAAPSSGTASSAYSDTVFVADTSPDITSYTIPF